MFKSSKRKTVLSAATRVLIVGALFFFASGCKEKPAVGGGNVRPGIKNRDMLSQEIMKKVSDRVLAGVPDTELMKGIRKRGVLRVELPAEKFPFQYLQDGRPAGFNVDLINEIGWVLGVKPNVKIGRGEMREMKELDIFVYESKKSAEGVIGGIPFFFLGERDGWLALYVADGDEGVTEGVERILDYLEETGIFARLYRRYFNEEGQHIQ